MIRVRQVKVNIENDSINNIKIQTAKKLNIKPSDILNIKINKQSIDARHKPEIYFLYEVDVTCNNESNILRKNKSNDILIKPNEEYKINVSGTKKLEKLVVVGAGPAGLMNAYILASLGYKPLVIERGKKVEDRVKDVEEFFKTGILNTNSNVQFGEGGAGTFSDGKLNTMVKDKEHRCKFIFKTLVECGAPEDILYAAKPHIGTDLLRNVIINLRNKIISLGGEFRYNTCLTDINIINNEISSIIVNNNEKIKCNCLVLALGHSSRDTFKMLYEKKLDMEAKPFAVGIRIQHPQSMINMSQIGVEKHDKLLNQSYKLTYQTSKKRGVYTFCMCPGGYVVNSSSENNMTCINGMSNHARESGNANSAIIVTVNSNDFGNNPMDGINFQRELEKKAYEIGEGKIPTQLYGDFKNNKITKEFKEVKPKFKGDYKFANINDILPNYITEALIEGIENFANKIKNYNREDAIISAVEARTSSPIKIIRDDLCQTKIVGIFPCGEGAGYAGGITSACMDGLKVAEGIVNIYNTPNI